MQDLHSKDSVTNHYADRYQCYMPIDVRNGLRSNSIDASNSSLPWDVTLPLVTTEDVSRDKALGAFVGLAVGDAVGTTLEFKKRDSEHVADMIGGGPFQLKPGEWTDDTSMALCLAETYLSENRMHTDVLRKYLLKWYLDGENSSNGRCFDIGNTTRFALEQYMRVGPSGMVIQRNTLLVMLGLFVKHRYLSFVENHCVRFTSNHRLRVEQRMAR